MAPVAEGEAVECVLGWDSRTERVWRKSPLRRLGQGQVGSEGLLPSQPSSPSWATSAHLTKGLPMA